MIGKSLYRRVLVPVLAIVLLSGCSPNEQEKATERLAELQPNYENRLYLCMAQFKFMESSREDLLQVAASVSGARKK